MRRPAAVVAALALGVMLASCSAGPVTDIDPVVSAPEPTFTPVDAAAFAPTSGLGERGVEFDSPSGRISCGYYEFSSIAGYWGCSIDDYTFAFPEPSTPDEQDCAAHISWGGGFIVEPGGEVEVLCRGGVMFGGEYAPVPVLPLGSSLTYAEVECTVSAPGGEETVTCRDTEAGHGFSLARDAFDRF